MRKSPFALLFFVVNISCFAQFSGFTYPKAKLYLKDYSIVKVKKLEIGNMIASFYNKATNKSETLSLENINLITIQKRSHVWEGAAYGAFTGALTGLLVDIGEDPLGRPNEVTIEEYIGITAVGAALGAIIGSFFPKWKQIYSRGEFLGLNVPMNLNLKTQKDKVVVKITIPL